ncbi:unnamed protein product [Amoebophrya sp. A25]|nr:unnamed protein product [Amoebophrya sp. A25]|eukprot:GSA25T00017128001.1
MQAFYHSVRPAVATATMRPCAPATSGAFGGLAASSSSSTFQFHRRRTFSTATGGAAFEVEIHGRQLLVDEHRLENTLARLTSRTASSSTSTSLTSNSTASASSSHLPTSAVNRTTTTRSANYTATTSTTVTSSSHPPPTSSASPRDTRPRALPGLEHRGLTSYPATSDILRDLALGSREKYCNRYLPREDATFQISHDFYTEEERVEKVQSQKKSLVAMNQLEMYNAGGTHHPGGCLLQITQTGEVVERDETDLSIPRHVRLALHKRPINPVHERITYHERNYPDCPKTGRKSWARRWHEHAIVRHWGGLYMFCFFFSLATIVKFSLQSQEDITFITDPRRRTSGYYYLHQEDLDRM